MKLKRLNIELAWYGEFSGQYVGKVEFQDREENSVAMTLPPAISNVVLAALGDNLAKITQTTADKLAANIKRSIYEVNQPAIEAPKPDGATAASEQT